MNIVPLIKELAGLFRQTFPRSITIETDIARDLSPVNADPTQLHQVLTNLCVNARDAMPDGGRLRIIASERMLCEREIAELPAGRYVAIVVEDTGTGIPADVLPRIFEPFFTTKEAGKGTGLGLSTSQGIVKSHDGAIEVESEPGRGSRFRIFLPARDSAKAKPPEPARREPPAARGELVLVIDDEAALLNIAKLTLTSAGYRVLTARNGVEALAMHGQRMSEIDLVLTDQMMPVMDGTTTIAALRRERVRAKILVCSGMTNGQDTADSVGAAFLPKPYTVDALLTKVRTVLDS
jgi:CheY-like chemotaxis protein